ncbi:MAG: hypothetical protein Ct9H300mP32_2130 [Verrucomicrobiota bacterium]|nr:MAG: hypothetical protein Ct9H300mP32_2130 [Verrucomicrobiota bacterium]
MNKVLEYMAFAKPQVMFDPKEGPFSGPAMPLVMSENPPKPLARRSQNA